MRVLLFIFLIGQSTLSLAQFTNEKVINDTIIKPSSARAYDFDGDGDLDILTGTHKIVWYENYGGGAFSRGTAIDENMSATNIFAADLDADGDLDVIACNDVFDKISWYKNDGFGDFGPENMITDSLNYVQTIHATDIDADGDLDVLACGFFAHKAVWFENDGTGNFIAENLVWDEVTGRFRTTHMNDLDGDGDIDIVGTVPNFNELVWYENDGTGVFINRTIITDDYGFFHVHSVDLDDDGDYDLIATAGGDDGIFWFENDGGGEYGSPILITDEIDGPRHAWPADLDDDGDLDIISSSVVDNKIAWYENDGDENFGEQQIISLRGNEPYTVFAPDLDEDGDLDILFTAFDSDEIMWYKNNGEAEFSFESFILSSPHSPTSIKTIDFNGDGAKDVLYGSIYDGKIAWHENNGDGTFLAEKVVTDSVPGLQSVFASDLDGDGDLDVVSASTIGPKISWFENQGDMTFGDLQLISDEVFFPSSVFSSDLDGDGDNDVVSGSYSDNKVAWYENDGLGNFGAQQVIGEPAVGVENVFVIDIDSDGDMDILAACRNSDKIMWYVNDDGFDTEVIITDSADGAYSVHAGDFDGDGDIDVVSASRWDGKIAWYENDGIGGFIAEHGISLAVDSDPLTSVYAADFDGDSDLDIVATWTGEDRIAWFENDGTGEFGDENLIAESIHLEVVTSDLDGDGDMDIAACESTTDRLVWFENLFVKEEQISGRLFFDQNENGVYDSLEAGLSKIKALSSPENDYTFTYEDGRYFMLFTAYSGIYEIVPEEVPHWSVITDSLGYMVIVDSAFTSFDSLDFGFFPDSIITDVEPTLIGGFPRCNTLINYWLDFRNKGTTLPSGIYTITLDDDIDYIAANVEPDSVVDQTIYWHYDSLAYFVNDQINIQVELPSFEGIGDSLSSYLSIIEMDETGEEIYSNADTLHQILVCAYDPNDKMATPAGLDSLGFIPIITENLDYTVRFQNTGNDTAITVVIKDQLDENLDWYSMDIIASSHEMDIKVEGTGEVIFTFENIMLPDSNVNEIASHGFLRYSIDLLEDLPAPTSIYNAANIYFDANPAVVTNTKTNTLFDCNTILESIEFTSEFCQGEYFMGEASLTPSIAELNWTIEDLFDSTNYNVATLLDTFGLFDLDVTASTNFCSAHTTYSILINPRQKTFLDSLYICEGDSLEIFEVYRTIEGFYYDTLVAIEGCDSILLNYLEFYAATESYATETICEGDSLLIAGVYQSGPGLYVDTLSTIYGCDSIATINLSLNPLPEVEFFETEDETICQGADLVALTAEPLGGEFYGEGVIDAQFDPSIIGEYYIYYSFEDDNGCSAIDSITINVVDCLGLEEENYSMITLYPNPFDEFTTLYFGEELLEPHSVIIYDLLGGIVFQKSNLNGVSVKIKKESLVRGAYILVLYNEGEIDVYKTKLLIE